MEVDGEPEAEHRLDKHPQGFHVDPGGETLTKIDLSDQAGLLAVDVNIDLSYFLELGGGGVAVVLGTCLYVGAAAAFIREF